MPIPKKVIPHQFSFVCQQRWEDLLPTKSPSIRYCGICVRNVHLCDSVAALSEHSQSGHCIAYRVPSSASRRWWQFWKPKPQPSCCMGPVLVGMPAPPPAPPSPPLGAPPALPTWIRDYERELERNRELFDKVFHEGVSENE